jgi:hypothetical protein
LKKDLLYLVVVLVKEAFVGEINLLICLQGCYGESLGNSFGNCFSHVLSYCTFSWGGHVLEMAQSHCELKMLIKASGWS